MKVSEALASAGIDPRETRLLLAEATGFSEASVLAFQEKALPPEVAARFLDFVERRRCGEPVAYILGRKEFYGLECAVNPAVLIPRPETELLVELALERKPASVLDLGTGSGAIALAIKRHLPHARIVASDADAAALVVAKRNAVRHALEIEWVHARWLEGISERFELIVSNPPYVAEGDPHLADLRFEPAAALVSGKDGLEAMREIVRQAPRCLAPGGWLLLEHGAGQEVGKLMAGYRDVQSWRDLAGIPRVTGGRR